MYVQKDFFPFNILFRFSLFDNCMLQKAFLFLTYFFSWHARKNVCFNKLFLILHTFSLGTPGKMYVSKEFSSFYILQIIITHKPLKYKNKVPKIKILYYFTGLSLASSFSATAAPTSQVLAVPPSSGDIHLPSTSTSSMALITSLP